MGGSGGGGLGGATSGDIRDWMEQAHEEIARAEHDANVNEVLGDLLAQYNDRDVESIRDNLEEIQEVLEDSLETTIDLRFGGSVAKHTYVDGLSDVDALAILRDPEMESLPAAEVLDRFAEVLERELGYEVRVNEGKLAVTVMFPGEVPIQILPAIRTATGVRIPSSTGEGWSPVIRPDAFASKLTERNQENAGRLVPVVKLAKAAVADLPESIKPSGYHMESLAVEAFSHYSGAKTYKSMLHHFFQEASKLVMSPIRDNTGQSLHVDQNLGGENSRARVQLSGAMDRIARRMSNADRASSVGEWLGAIGE